MLCFKPSKLDQIGTIGSSYPERKIQCRCQNGRSMVLLKRFRQLGTRHTFFSGVHSPHHTRVRTNPAPSISARSHLCSLNSGHISMAKGYAL
ncbi:hypothetical protein RRG08_012420 [Elysia crispata]|uniref:Uncharacterized protein n=1 Tax=Elysia crispata TaxID=231223 RepID=A0AAE1AG28_9GAST|nr:hypothetical protein RRG08_012420 [Elysia crispata]